MKDEMEDDTEGAVVGGGFINPITPLTALHITNLYLICVFRCCTAQLSLIIKKTKQMLPNLNLIQFPCTYK